jgi:hypothetical protein
LIRVVAPRRDFGECQIRQPVGIVLTQAKPIDDEERHLAADVVSAIDRFRQTIEDLVEGRRHHPD